MFKSDVGHFAGTKHKGLPEKVARSSGQRGFFHMVRRAQSGDKPLSHYSDAVSSAAKKMIPKDATASPVAFTPTPQQDSPPEVSSKMSSLQKLWIGDLMRKSADIHSILSRSHKAVHQAGASRRQALGKEVARLQSENERMQNESEKAKATVADSEQKVREADMKVMAAGRTIEQIQAMQMSTRPQPPPEQPAYGSMLLGAAPGVRPAITPNVPAGQAAPAPAQPSIPGMQAPPTV